jgi:hypothetical protein
VLKLHAVKVCRGVKVKFHRTPRYDVEVNDQAYVPAALAGEKCK